MKSIAKQGQKDWKAQCIVLARALEKKSKEWRQQDLLLRDCIQKLSACIISAVPETAQHSNQLNSALSSNHNSIEPALVKISKLTSRSAIEQRTSEKANFLIKDSLNEFFELMEFTKEQRLDVENDLKINADPERAFRRIHYHLQSKTGQQKNTSHHHKNHTESCTATTSSPSAQDLAEVLLVLLDHLPIQDTSINQAKQLRSELNKGIKTTDLPTFFKKIADVTSGMSIHSDQQDASLETFILQITEELASIEKYVRIGNDDIKQSRNQSNDMRASIEGEMTHIENDTHSATDINQLKGSIENRLNTIRTSMTAFNEAEESRIHQAGKRNIELQKKLKVMERETISLREELNVTNAQLNIDTLTGVANRYAYEVKFEQLLQEINSGKIHCAFALWDIDHFKAINDTYGHKPGDRVLQLIAQLISHSLDDDQFFARIGGEEFVLILPNKSNQEAQLICDIIREKVAASGFNHKGQKVSLTISCGISDIRPNESVDDVFIRTDQALYEAKERGRNCVIISEK